jgi:hypothetical protein
VANPRTSALGLSRPKLAVPLPTDPPLPPPPLPTFTERHRSVLPGRRCRGAHRGSETGRCERFALTGVLLPRAPPGPLAAAYPTPKLRSVHQPRRQLAIEEERET